MPLNFVICLLLFVGLTFGVAWPLASRLMLDPAEKLGASAMLSLLATYVITFAIYVLRLPNAALGVLPLLAAVGFIAGWKQLCLTLRDADARGLFVGQLLVSGWCIGWLSFIANYSGGGWTADWFEHWQRSRFFLEHWPQDTKFLNLYPLPARPPLANLCVGAYLGLTGITFSKYQMVMSLLNSLAFLPAALLARRFAAQPSAPATAGRMAIAVITLLVLLNPSFLENATFAWTKLITACFVLSGLYFFLRARDAAPAPAALPLCAASLAAGLLAHYSAGPYIVLLAGAWFGLNRARLRSPAFWRQTGLAAAVGGLILATWFGWSLAVYGAHTTFLSNSSVTVKAAQTGNVLVKTLLNLRDTIVPHFLRPLNRDLIAQSSPWGYWRDWFFQLYQVNLFFIFGSVAWLVILRELARSWPLALPTPRRFWTWFAAGAIVLGVAVHGARDTWGLAHICLQSLMILGLGYLAARWATLSRGWRLALVAGLAIDFCLGIALQFGVESYAIDRWLTPGRTVTETINSYSSLATMNVYAKIYGKTEFLGDVLIIPAALVLALLAGILSLAVARATRRPV